MTDFLHHNLPDAPQDKDFDSAPNLVRTDKNFSVKEQFTVNDVETALLRGQKFKRRGVSTLITGTNFTLTTSDFLVGITSLSYAPSIGLPLPTLVGEGKTFIIKDEVGGAATTTITIRSDGEKTIDGATTSTLTTNYQAKSYYSDGANWFTFD